jgi:hypothetical protein
MHAGQYLGRDDSVAVRDSMPMLPWERVQRQVGDAGTEAGVWSTLVVVSDLLDQIVGVLKLQHRESQGE